MEKMGTGCEQSGYCARLQRYFRFVRLPMAPA